MKTNEFYQKYANTPLSKRFVILNMNKFGDMTLHDFHEKISQMEDIIRPWQIKLDKYLKDVEPYLKLLAQQSSESTTGEKHE